MDEIDVVADSEGEELGFVPPKARRKDVLSIDTAETNVSSGQTRPSPIVMATSFVASLDALLNVNVEENATRKPKPRPRPKFRNKETGRAGADASTSFTDTTTTPHTRLEDDMDFPNILSIADRAKMRQRITKQPSYGQRAHSHISDDEDELSHSYHVPDGNEEFNSHKTKKKKNLFDDLELHESDPLGSFGKVIYEPNPTLPPQLPPGLYTPETRLEPQSPPAQTKPKPRPVKRSNKTKSSLAAAGQPTSPPSIPIATSPLPPSDPPLPFSSSHQHNTPNADHREINAYDDSLPPIESLPAPTSSPSSLFSAAVGDEGQDAHIVDATGHIRDSPSLEGDPLLMGPPLTVLKEASSIDKPNQNTHIIDINKTSSGLDENPRFMEPPSTFFKGASSLDHPSSPKPKERKSGQREEQVEVIDLCTVPPKIVDLKEIGKKGTKAKGREKFDDLVPETGKTKGRGKRKASDDDDFGISGDDGDDDYEDSAKRKKAKTKTKGKKAEGKLATKKAVEVIVEVPIHKKAGKQKAVELPSAVDENERPSTGTIADKEAHLSTSRVLDGDHRSLDTRSRSIKELDLGPPASPVPDSEGEDMQGLFDMEMAAAKSKRIPITPTPAPRTGKKRPKRVVSDDEDQETYNGEEEKEKTTSPKKKAKTKERHAQTQGKNKRKTREVVLSDDGESHEPTATTKGAIGRNSHERRKASRVLSGTEDEAPIDGCVKENIRPHSSGVSSSASKPTSSSHAEFSSPLVSDKPVQVNNADANIDTSPKVANPQPTSTSLTSRYTIAPKTRSTPMSELIRRVNSKPLSPLTSPPRSHAKVKNANKSTSIPTPTPTRPSQGVTTYSPYLKASRSFLSRIAPLHPHRRTPPPPPPPPPRKKSKKELELEEKWEEELIDSVGGAAAWSCLSEDERKDMKRHKWAVERGEIDD